MDIGGGIRNIYGGIKNVGTGFYQGLTGQCPPNMFWDTNKNQCMPIQGGIPQQAGMQSGPQGTITPSQSTVGQDAMSVEGGGVEDYGAQMSYPSGSPPSTTSGVGGTGSQAGNTAIKAGATALGTAIGGPIGGMAGDMLADTALSFGSDKKSGSDRLAEEKAKTERWKRMMSQKYAGPTQAVGQTMAQNMMLGAMMPVAGPALAAANTTRFLLQDVLPYLANPTRITEAKDKGYYKWNKRRG